MWRFALVMVIACGGAAPHSSSARYDTDLDAVLAAATDVAKHNAKTATTSRSSARDRGASHASRWQDGLPKPQELPDDNPPAWLTERRDHIFDDINARLKASAVAQQ